MKHVLEKNVVRKVEFENMLGVYEVTHIEGDDVRVTKLESCGMVTNCRNEIIMRQVTLLIRYNPSLFSFIIDLG